MVCGRRRCELPPQVLLGAMLLIAVGDSLRTRPNRPSLRRSPPKSQRPSEGPSRLNSTANYGLKRMLPGKKKLGILGRT
jgi:hypothetical protein